MAKRHIPAGQVAQTLDVADFEMLQADVNQLTGVGAAQTKSPFAPTRDALQHLSTAHGSVILVCESATCDRAQHAEVTCALILQQDDRILKATRMPVEATAIGAARARLRDHDGRRPQRAVGVRQQHCYVSRSREDG